MKKNDLYEVFGVGNTPLILAGNISNFFGFPVWLKLESTLPYSHTFKDRGALSAVLKAKEDGKSIIMCASCGNMSSAVVPIAAKMNIKTNVIVSEECCLPNKVAMAMAGANIIEYAGRFDEIDDIISEYSIKNPDIPCINTNYLEFYAKGLESLYFEIFDQLSDKYDDINIVVPTADGTLLASLFNAHQTCKDKYPDINFNPHFILAQPSLCSPLVDAYDTGLSFNSLYKGSTDVLSLSVDNPKINGSNALNAVEETDGLAISVDETKVLENINLLASTEGIFTDDVGGICIGSLPVLSKSLAFRRPTVCLMTGNGLKTYSKHKNIYPSIFCSDTDSVYAFLEDSKNN